MLMIQYIIIAIILAACITYAAICIYLLQRISRLWFEMENRWSFHQVLYLFLGVEQVQGDA